MASSLRGQFESEGFAVARGLYSSDEVEFYRHHFMEMRKTEQPHDDTPPDLTAEDPLRRVTPVSCIPIVTTRLR